MGNSVLPHNVWQILKDQLAASHSVQKPTNLQASATLEREMQSDRCQEHVAHVLDILKFVPPPNDAGKTLQNQRCLADAAANWQIRQKTQEATLLLERYGKIQ